MARVPVHGGRPCLFRVVRVSGTVRKVEEEAVRRAKLLVLAARDEMAGKASSDALGALLRGDGRVGGAAVVGGEDDGSDGLEGGMSDEG